jgi:aryl-alcohol dehydrogenase-like predicted oxidoreductase
MRTVTLGTTGLAVTPLAYGTWQFGGDWGPAGGPTPEGMS